MGINPILPASDILAAMKPLLLLDIDGVLAPFLPEEDLEKIYNEEPHTHKEVRISMMTTVYVRRDLPEIMSELMQYFELMWGTAWGGHEANTYMLKHLGLEDHLDAIDYRSSVDGVVIKFSGLHFTGDTMPDFWKMPWIEHFAEESGRPFVFIDDEIGEQAKEWAQQRTEAGIPTLMVQTQGHIGWTDEHKDELIAWAKEVAVDEAEGQGRR